MKVVILAGGYGTRISEESKFKPKPMIEIGGMPILWHIMKECISFSRIQCNRSRKLITPSRLAFYSAFCSLLSHFNAASVVAVQTIFFTFFRAYFAPAGRPTLH